TERAMGDRIAVGVIRKAHGVRGEASVESWTASLDRFNELTKVTLVSPDEESTREAEIESARAHGDRALVKFRGVESPDDVEELRNWTIEIPLSDARKLEEDEYFLHDLVGLRLVDREGRDRGVVKEAYEGGGGILLAVDGPNGEFDVPFASEICTEIDVAGGRIVVDLPEGIDDLSHVED
ncbi:MAG TPA: ribosome maturation factor RimM, partial [Thermoanaerobaculia bacterium]|nr:ribosome maturation factor RimM [Thermoanaerobaculia bacterium]